MPRFPPVAESPDRAVDDYLETVVTGHGAQLAPPIGPTLVSRLMFADA
jgi:hypothetical protein